MSDAVHWTLEVVVNDGQLGAFKALLGEMVASTKSEVNTLMYEWYFNEDESVCFINERYRDSAAAMTHLQAFGGFAERFMASVKPKRLVVMGKPGGDVREALAGLDPDYYEMHAGFSR